MTEEIEIKEAVEIVKKYINEGLDYNSAEFGTAVVNLLTLAQEYLKAKMPQEITNYISFRDTVGGKLDSWANGYNQALHDFRLWQVKRLGKVSKKNRLAVYKSLSQAIQAIHKLFEKEE